MASAAGGCATTSLAFAALLLATCASTAAAAKYTVGDKSGWAMGADYTTWASDKKMKVGDTLVFNYVGGAHTVDEVSAADYAACSSGNAISSDSTGATSVALKTPGKHYFICGVASHCSNGMKLVVDVAKAAAPAPAPKAAPVPTAPDAPSDDTPSVDTPASPTSSGGAAPKTPATVLAPPVKASGAAGLRAAAWASFGLAGLVAVHLGFF